jgi:hypothetical protein
MPLTYKESESAPGRIRTSDSRFRKPSRFVYPCSPGLEFRLSKPFWRSSVFTGVSRVYCKITVELL